ncbi:MAG TPA: class I SAM-dependent methyltransferase [Blastocatellia bacterium]|nr:class I SAM-dependent methyltransferase [Blastocatellia bacterium]
MNAVRKRQEDLLPDRLKATWQVVEAKQITAEEFDQRQIQWLREYREIWNRALRFGPQAELTESLISELALFTGDDSSEIEQRCRRTVGLFDDQWSLPASETDLGESDQIQHEHELYDLMWWHTLNDDDSPLGYVTALDFAQRNGCHHYLDFGAGVGAGAILFAQHGFDVEVADLSWFLLAFSEWRMEKRQLPGRFVDLNESPLPDRAFDFITAMDGLEHLADPTGVIADLDRSLKAGGYLFGQFQTGELELNQELPPHQAPGLSPAIEHLQRLGFVEVWRDEWLWGHQAFQKQR